MRSPLILIDVCMPDLDGFELAAMIREHPRFPDDRHHLRLGGHDGPSGSAARLSAGRASTTCRCRWCRSCCAPRSRCSWICTARPGSWSASTPSSSSGSPSAPRSCSASTRSWSCGSRSARASAKRRSRSCSKRKRWTPSGNSTGGVAHDFNNLLMAVLGSLDAAREAAARRSAQPAPAAERRAGSAAGRGADPAPAGVLAPPGAQARGGRSPRPGRAAWRNCSKRALGHGIELGLRFSERAAAGAGRTPTSSSWRCSISR